ncbi:uncharacterized protein LOC117901700 isoform X2 [Drosophila subobscura]|uniref:uncharacterized protein LOC117901700 isoform X2 n=1 Tax=Drosophila subobscura TaxID=7241 RepID=UPI00155A53C2|nr:uncharacterized protein LOC117901700 isoform X2 [Drosophila subobscura]
MQYTKCKTMLMLAVLALSLTLSLSAPSPQQLNAELESTLQDSSFSSSDPDLNPINAESKGRRPRAGDQKDAAELDGSMVSLDLPSGLFDKSFRTITNVAKSLSGLIMGTARRYSRFVLFFKPIFGDALVVEGFEDPTTTTTTRRTTIASTTTTESVDKLNEV